MKTGGAAHNPHFHRATPKCAGDAWNKCFGCTNSADGLAYSSTLGVTCCYPTAYGMLCRAPMQARVDRRFTTWVQNHQPHHLSVINFDVHQIIPGWQPYSDFPSLSIAVVMSDLQRSFAKASLSRLPPEPPPDIPGEHEEEQDDLANLRPGSPNDSSSSASSADSTGTIVPSLSRNLFEKPRR